MNTLETLIKARDLIQDKAHWIKGVLAADKDGYECSVSKAARWCSVGAVFNIQGDENGHSPAFKALSDAADGSIAEFNDSNTHAAVIAMFDRAIEAERAAEHA